MRRAGSDLTVVAALTMVHHALAVAQTLALQGISVDVIDPRTLVHFDTDALLASVRKTGRLLVVDEAYVNFGLQAEVIASITERAFDALKTAPPGQPGCDGAVRAAAAGRCAAQSGTHRSCDLCDVGVLTKSPLPMSMSDPSAYAWRPNDALSQASNAARFMRALGVDRWEPRVRCGAAAGS